MAFVVEAPVPATLPVEGEPLHFPIRRVYCVGRNYAAHAREMGHDPDREPPFFFQKNPHDVYVGGEFPYPSRSADVHHEIELVVALQSGGSNIEAARALEHVYGYAVGLDMTRRDLQGEAKKLGRPWEIGKAFDASAPCTPILAASTIGHPREGRVWLDVNGETRQDGNLDELIWDVPEIIEHLSRLFTLAPGDLVFTGTPAGVGAVSRGDVLHGGVEGVAEIEIKVV